MALSAGICVAHYLPTKTIFWVVGGVACSLAALVLVITRRIAPAAFTLLLAFFFVGVVLARPAQKSGTRDFTDRPVIITGVIDGPPEYARDRLYLSLRTPSERVWLLAPFRNAEQERAYRALNLRYGARVSVGTTLDRTGNYRNPGVSPLSEYLDRRDFDATGIVRSPASIVRLDDAPVFRPLAWLYDWRERLQREIDSRFAPETAGILDAALLGNRYNLSRSASERFREGGTFHVLVISGLHISFIGGLVFLIVRRFTKRRLLQFLLPAIIIWAYSLAVGADASVVRAALMFTFAGLAAIVFRQATSLNALGGAAIVILVHSPKEIFDPSFQLTFLSVLAIVVVAWPLLLRFAAIGSWHPARSTPYPPACSRGLKTFCEILFWSEKRWQQELTRSSHHCRLFKAAPAEWLERYHLQSCLRYVFGAMVVSASVQLVLLPLMIFYFHRVSLASPVLTIVVSVLLAVLIAIALLALLISQVSAAVAAPLLKLANAIEWLMVHSVDPFSSLRISELRLPEYSGPAVLIYALYYLPLLLLAIVLAYWRPLASPHEPRSGLHRFIFPIATAQMLLLTLLILHPFSSGHPDARLRVDFLDVGQGDSALVTMPDGTTLLVDGGGRPSFGGSTDSTRRIGETVVSEYLWWRGLSEVDYVLATHLDADHTDGLNDVVRNFEVRGALIARRPIEKTEFVKFAETLRKTGTHVEMVQAGDTIRFGDVEVSVLWPLPESNGSSNDDSIVLRIKLGNRSILLTGDIEKATEGALTAMQRDLRADVVKVPHHGSKTSSTEAFVRATRPAFAIISVGRSSMFGHPHKEVVDRWQASGATVLTTGHSGMITVTTDGTDLWTDTFVKDSNHSHANPR